MRLVPIPLSTVGVLHEVLFPLHREVFGSQPHIDPEIKSPEPKKEIAAVISGARSNEELPSHFRQRTLYEKSLCVRTSVGHVVQLQAVDGRAGQSLIDRRQVGLAMEDDVHGVFRLASGVEPPTCCAVQPEVDCSRSPTRRPTRWGHARSSPSYSSIR
jgi:hypothetical protein